MRVPASGLKQSLADSCVLWLPLQLALWGERHDTQEEIDAILRSPSTTRRARRPASFTIDQISRDFERKIKAKAGKP